ncbi:MAG: DNA polymerase, partial [Roseiflexaceae bacterium]|nr:DNA polymerase [Roseiflexaceae bacterium]
SADSGSPHEGGATRLFASGVARRVVKADVASLYPSLMRTYRIGPACDRIGALLGVLTALLDLRLQHKDAARAAAVGSIERSHHDSLQAAMKLMINAAYGYMGAGEMALFADKHAADAVTRYGRELLDQLCQRLEAGGATLIEADTDGVYFAVPETWDEAAERALVANVAATLPQGIRLEYEGRFQSMLSHEIKNYALLTYDGQLIVRGAAMRSSRSEPYGEAFLRAALACLLRGDVPGVAEAFQQTANALRQRDLTANDVATRVRLSKSPEEYLSTRTRHQQQQYEALLAAGRRDWRPGERVRFYRRADKSAVWLPDALEQHNQQQTTDDGQQTDYDIEHYLNILVGSYAERLKKAFAPGDFAQLFRADTQIGLFDTPPSTITPLWIEA